MPSLMGKKMSRGVSQTTGNLNWGALLFVALGAVLLVVAWQGTQGKLWQAITGQGSVSNMFSSTGINNSTSLQPLQLTPSQLCAAFPIQCITQQQTGGTSNDWSILQPLSQTQIDNLNRIAAAHKVGQPF